MVICPVVLSWRVAQATHDYVYIYHVKVHWAKRNQGKAANK
jgi:hypothetical protein